VYFAYISNKNGCSGSFYVNDPYFKTSYFVLKWAKVIKLPIFIMLFFKTVVATPGKKYAKTRIKYGKNAPKWHRMSNI
jgi:hypothetical protein